MNPVIETRAHRSLQHDESTERLPAGDAPPCCSSEVSVLVIDPTSRFSEELRSNLTSGPQQLASSADECLVIVLPEPWSLRKSGWESAVESAAQAKHFQQVVICSSFSAHFNTRVCDIETRIRGLFEAQSGLVTVLRLGHIVDHRTELVDRPRGWSAFAELAPSAFSSVFLHEAELEACLRTLIGVSLPSHRGPMTFLGVRHSLAELRRAQARQHSGMKWFRGVATLLRWLLVLPIIQGMWYVLARWGTVSGFWLQRELLPSSREELISLVRQVNRRHVVIAGYNTGVNHFGWKFPGRTVVKTIETGCRMRIRHDLQVDVDAGTLLGPLIAELRKQNLELPVVPNYSFVSLGTVFMVPVHGSGSRTSVLGDAIERVVAFDPAREQIVRLRRGTPEFEKALYSPDSGLVVLRLRLRIHPCCRYYVQRRQLNAPDADEVWRSFDDPEATHVELRKSRAASNEVEVSRYYTGDAQRSDLLEVPRDSIGAIWDRIESQPIASWLFHTFVRQCGFHVELFLDRRQFAIFWRHHQELPLLKLQLRLLHRRSLPRVPTEGSDFISVDLFMKRRRRHELLDFMKEHLADAQYNPGKHSL